MTEIEVDEPAAQPALATPATAASPPSRRHRRRRARSWRRSAIEWISIALVAVILALGIRSFVFQAFYVPSTSMVPTLQVGDRILVQKLFFKASDLKTGDIIVFRRPATDTVCGTNETDLVKRVIGLPGETVSSKGNTVYLNGVALSEPWLPKGLPLGLAISKPFTVPQGQYYVMGDNRPVSCDSRYWGTVPAQNVVGKVVLLWWRGGRPAAHIF